MSKVYLYYIDRPTNTGRVGTRRSGGCPVNNRLPGAVDGPFHDFDVLSARRTGLVQLQHGPLHDGLERETPSFRVLVHQALGEV